MIADTMLGIDTGANNAADSLLRRILKRMFITHNKTALCDTERMLILHERKSVTLKQYG